VVAVVATVDVVAAGATEEAAATVAKFKVGAEAADLGVPKRVAVAEGAAAEVVTAVRVGAEAMVVGAAVVVAAGTPNKVEPEEEAAPKPIGVELAAAVEDAAGVAAVAVPVDVGAGVVPKLNPSEGVAAVVVAAAVGFPKRLVVAAGVPKDSAGAVATGAGAAGEGAAGVPNPENEGTAAAVEVAAVGVPNNDPVAGGAAVVVAAGVADGVPKLKLNPPDAGAAVAAEAIVGGQAKRLEEAVEEAAGVPKVGATAAAGAVAVVEPKLNPPADGAGAVAAGVPNSDGVAVVVAAAAAPNTGAVAAAVPKAGEAPREGAVEPKLKPPLGAAAPKVKPVEAVVVVAGVPKPVNPLLPPNIVVI